MLDPSAAVVVAEDADAFAFLGGRPIRPPVVVLALLAAAVVFAVVVALGGRPTRFGVVLVAA